MSRRLQTSLRRILPRAAAGCLVLLATSAQIDPPPGWGWVGRDTDAYELSLDPGGGRGGSDCVLIETVREPAEKSFAGVQQSVPAGPYRGGRLRLGAWVRTEDVTGWAGIYLRVDGRHRTDGPGRELLAVDNMRNRPIRGTSGWRRHDVVLDVPDEAVVVAFGTFLMGAGTLRVDDFELELVDSRVEVTRPPVERPPTDRPDGTDEGTRGRRRDRGRAPEPR
ncbi:MAG: hypothetical protein PVG07_08875 [Acidobacteriota bacterium]|jgi:hypothetical protein